MTSNAVISDCGRFRYRLERGDLPRLTFVMLNPSTADALQDDPTIRRCAGFAKREGYNGIHVVNLYALRATNPKELWKHADRVGPLNHTCLEWAGYEARRIVVAWGANAEPAVAHASIQLLRKSGARLVCLGKTKDGSPRHPLYVRGDQPLVDFT